MIAVGTAAAFPYIVEPVVAARAAGMPVAVAAWGYLPAEEDPASWAPDRLVRHPSQLLSWLGLAA